MKYNFMQMSHNSVTSNKSRYTVCNKQGRSDGWPASQCPHS